MKQYHDQLAHILEHGVESSDRTGVGTISCFDVPNGVYNLQEGFPLVTTKKVFTRGIIEELLWMLSGSTNVKPLQDKRVHIWDEWAYKDGDLGPIYGHQWRNWGGGVHYKPRLEYNEDGTVSDRVAFTRTHWVGLDQISTLIEGIKNDPASRRHIVSAWNVSDLSRMALAPCHCFFQVYVRDQTLSLKLYQRSADMFLGVPFNIASYALLTHMLAAQTGNKPGHFIHVIGDAHIYLNHITQVKEQLGRKPYSLPALSLNPDVKSIFDYKLEDIQIIGYNSHPTIKGEIAV